LKEVQKGWCSCTIMSTSFSSCASKSKSWVTCMYSSQTQNKPCTTNRSTFHSFAARRASSTKLTMTKTSILCGFSLFSSYAQTCSMYVPKLVPKANQMAAGSLSRTAGMQGSSETSISSRIQPRSPTPVGIGIPAAMLSLEWTYCNCFLKISELSKPDSFLWMGINLLVVVLTCCKESKTPTATDSYYHVWRHCMCMGAPTMGL
jgi:hypothetical protein